MIRTTACLAAAAAALAAAAGAQQRLEIDSKSGREIVNDWQYGFREFAAVDHDRRVIYVADAGEPLALTAFSLDDGALVGVYGGGEGDGPGELQYMVAAAATSDGVFVSDHVRVNHWDPAGSLVSVWRPNAPGVAAVCSLMGEPAAPLRGGALVRVPDGPDAVLGNGTTGNVIVVNDISEIRAASSTFFSSGIACTGDTAYVLSGGRLAGHRANNQTFEVPIPAELAEYAQRKVGSLRPGVYMNHYSDFFGDDKGNVVVTQWGREAAGAIIDPATGCHAILVDREPLRRSRRLVAVHRDSAVVLGSTPYERDVDGRRRMVLDGESYIIAIRPLRVLEGEPCP